MDYQSRETAVHPAQKRVPLPVAVTTVDGKWLDATMLMLVLQLRVRRSPASGSIELV